MYEPSLYALLGVALYYGYEPFRFSWKPAVLAGILYALAYFLFPAYKLVFAASFMLAAGRFVFPHTFRGWKWVACSVLFFISLLTGLIWQQISLLSLVVPPFLIPAIQGVL
jgi:hypothetical protein